MANTDFVVFEATTFPRDPSHRDAVRSSFENIRTWAPASRIVAVVEEQCEPWWGSVLAALPPENIVTLSCDRGQGVAAMVGALEVCRRAPRARTVLTLGSVAHHPELPFVPIGRSIHRVGPGVLGLAGEAASLTAWLASLRPSLAQSLIFACATQTSDSLDAILPRLPYFDLDREALLRVPRIEAAAAYPRAVTPSMREAGAVAL